jgi:hypothetical protein
VLSNELIKEINSNFEKMGLKTKVVLFNNNWRSPDDFNSAYLDDSDSFVAVGAVNDVKKFMKKQLSEDDYDEYFKNWSGGNNVERGVNTGQGAAVDANSILSTKKNVENNDEIPTNAEWAAYLITHALGHNAGLNHNLENPRFGQMVENCAHMCSANLTKAFITDGNYLYTDDKGRKGWKTVDNSNLKTLSDFTNPDFNETYIEKMKEKFGEEEGQDNYNYNKSQEEFSLPNIVNKELLLGSENSQ